MVPSQCWRELVPFAIQFFFFGLQKIYNFNFIDFPVTKVAATFSCGILPPEQKETILF